MSSKDKRQNCFANHQKSPQKSPQQNNINLN